jgi:hypothetical protein
MRKIPLKINNYKHMKISIITATYNSAAHITGCLASVNSQTRQVNHARQASHTMTQSHGMSNSGQNLRKNNTTQASFEIEHIIINGASRGQRTENSGQIRLPSSVFRLPSSDFCLLRNSFPNYLTKFHHLNPKL